MRDEQELSSKWEKVWRVTQVIDDSFPYTKVSLSGYRLPCFLKPRKATPKEPGLKKRTNPLPPKPLLNHPSCPTPTEAQWSPQSSIVLPGLLSSPHGQENNTPRGAEGRNTNRGSSQLPQPQSPSVNSSTTINLAF